MMILLFILKIIIYTKRIDNLKIKRGGGVAIFVKKCIKHQ